MVGRELRQHCPSAPGPGASGCEGLPVGWAHQQGKARRWGYECGEQGRSLGLRRTLPGKSKPKYWWLFSFFPRQIFQGILDAEWLDGAGCDIIVVSSPLLRCLHADLSSLPQASQPA